MKDDDSLYFSFDDQEEGEEEEDQVQAEEGQNKSFLYGIIALAAVFFLILCLGVGYIFLRPQLSGLLGGQPTQVSSNELTNQANMAAFALTQTAAFETQTAPTEPSTITSPTPRTSPTPTSGVAVTVIGTGTAEGAAEGTQVAEITPGAGTPTAEKTPGATSQTTPTVRASGLVTPTQIRPTSSIIEVTPLGGSGATPTRIVSGVGGTVSPAATGVGGPIQPTVQATLPNTGFAGSTGLLGAGFLAIVLVAVVVIARRIRLH